TGDDSGHLPELPGEKGLSRLVPAPPEMLGLLPLDPGIDGYDQLLLLRALFGQASLDLCRIRHPGDLRGCDQIEDLPVSRVEKLAPTRGVTRAKPASLLGDFLNELVDLLLPLIFFFAFLPGKGPGNLFKEPCQALQAFNNHFLQPLLLPGVPG